MTTKLKLKANDSIDELITTIADRLSSEKKKVVIRRRSGTVEIEGDLTVPEVDDLMSRGSQ